MLKIAVAGAHGRVGQCLKKVLEADVDTECAASIVRDPKTPQETTLSTLDNSYKNKLDCFIDFSTPAATLQNINFCLKNKIPLVIGTTGFSDSDKAEIKKATSQLPIVLAPNMSIGINLLYKLLEISGTVLNGRAETAILDVHHKHKKDAPSGTALKLNEVIAKSVQAGQKNDASSNTKMDISNIASLRIGNTLGEHKVWFTMEDEEVILSHKTLDRMVYAKGAVLAAKWLVQQKPGLYDMHDVLNLNWIMNKESYV